MASYLTQDPTDINQYYTAPKNYRAQAAPPPPPLRSAAARGRQQTLGPMFSEEEDGDDSEYIANRMKEMALGQGYQQDPNALAVAQMNQLRLQQQSLQLQQQYLLQQLLTQQAVSRGQPTREMQEAARLQQMQQMQQMHQIQLQAQMRQQVDPRVQAQLLAHLQATATRPARDADLRAQALAAQAQLQAQAQAQIQAQSRARADAKTQGEVEGREQVLAANREQARVEAKNPNRLQTSTKEDEEFAQSTYTAPENEKSPVKPATLGRFAQARLQSAANPFGELTALLARRSAETSKSTIFAKQDDTLLPATIVPTPAGQTEERLAARQALQTLGHGRPASTAVQNRAKSSPFPVSPSHQAETTTVRAVSMAQPLKPIRQPFGPPGPTNELGDKNFAAMARKKAGKGLGMLGRRGETGSGETTPVIA